MFLRSKLAKQCQLFSQRISSTLHNNKRSIENAALITAAAMPVYYYQELSDKVVQSHVNFFKSRLTLEQREEIATSPEKNKEQMEECKRELAFMLHN